MANDYAPRQFLRQVQNALLREYFAHRHVLGEVDWDNLKETEIEALYEKWRDLPELVRKGIESDFRSIHAMGVPEGTRALIEEGRFHQLELARDLDRLDGHLNKAFWVFFHHNQVFDVAARLHRADHLSGRYWRKRKDIPKKQPDVSPEALQELANAIAAYYWETQGRGSPCRAEAYLRAGRYHYVFVYPKDYSDTFIGYDDNGRFERRPQNPAFEVIYVYDPEDGALELYVRGDKKLVSDLQELFGRAILHEELGEETRDAVAFTAGVIPEPGPFKAEWTPPGFGSVDPYKDSLATLNRIRTGTLTVRQAIAEQGYDPDAQLEQIAEINRLLDEKGIVLDSDPRRVTQSGTQQKELTP